MKSIICNKAEALSRAAEQIKEVLSLKPNAVLALDEDKNTAELFTKLADMCQKKEIGFENVSIFLVSDFDEAPPGMSRREKIAAQLLNNINIKKENCFFIDKDNYKNYDNMIAEKGGIDLAVLGIGDNAHIGFNEPACPFSCLSHVQRITDATKRQYAEELGGEEKVPSLGITMGIKSICSARKFMVLAFGEEKSEPVFKMFYGRNDSRFPAAFLQIPSDVCCYLDEAAADKL